MARQRLAREDRARAIAQAAVGLFARRGFSGVTTRQIACAAGVSEGLVFKHFPHKDSLYRTILQAKMQEIERTGAMDPAVDSLDDEGFLAAAAGDVFRRVDADDTFMRLLMHSALEGHPLAKEFRRRRVDRIRERVERRIRLRFARRGWQAPVDPALAARIFTGMILASVLNRRLFHEPVVARQPAERWARVLARVFLYGLEGEPEKS
ncbi:MAG: TetR/AcrR family transcriptional regulator [Acidobacteria bacterium]|nr:TetR/AcrR family transcriptional regulator [Acidobacteriota bacterium]